MQDLTLQLWEKQNQHPGDRLRLFTAVSRAVDVDTALYPGSYVDVAASFAFPSVTYVDSDARAARFFSDSTGVDEIITQHVPPAEERTWEFIGADYTTDLGLSVAQFDLLISLYAGFVSEPCTRHLRPGGWLLVNPRQPGKTHVGLRALMLRRCAVVGRRRVTPVWVGCPVSGLVMV